MASCTNYAFPLFIVQLVIIVLSLSSSTSLFCVGLNAVHNVSAAGADWSDAGATWYGPPTGAGTDGGACGFGSSVRSPPLNSMVAAGGNSLFQGGEGCGACYEVKCTSNQACSGSPVTVVIADQCPGGPCDAESAHFDLSGTAFGAMAKQGAADQLRAAGQLQIQHRRVPCFYPGTTISFAVDAGSNQFYLATVIEFENGDGELGYVEMKQAANSDPWVPMQRSWGAQWKLNSGSALRAPLSFRLTSATSKRSVVAENVIPYGWTPGQTYWSNVNF
ncbi:unnamed protein product [Linum trigynum]|uniref:Uncharacterized protein n=1 Tax=Linum trigynum TaxID=586398 RepID=A0AAV2G105_9ROSI